MLVTIITSLVIAAATAYLTYMVQVGRLREELKTEFMAERVAKRLLESPRWNQRSFEEIKKRLAGFDDNELRKILVRSGAVSFEDKNGKELWGLITKNVKNL